MTQPVQLVPKVVAPALGKNGFRVHERGVWLALFAQSPIDRGKPCDGVQPRGHAEFLQYRMPGMPGHDLTKPYVRSPGQRGQTGLDERRHVRDGDAPLGLNAVTHKSEGPLRIELSKTLEPRHAAAFRVWPLIEQTGSPVDGLVWVRFGRAQDRFRRL